MKDEMRSLFVRILHGKKGARRPDITVQLRVRTEERGREIAQLVKAEPPPRFEMNMATIRPYARNVTSNGELSSGRGRVRELTMKFNRTDTGEYHPTVPKLREHFRPAWELSRAPVPAPPSLPSDGRPSSSSANTKPGSDDERPSQ